MKKSLEFLSHLLLIRLLLDINDYDDDLRCIKLRHPLFLWTNIHLCNFSLKKSSLRRSNLSKINFFNAFFVAAWPEAKDKKRTFLVVILTSCIMRSLSNVDNDWTNWELKIIFLKKIEIYAQGDLVYFLWLEKLLICIIISNGSSHQREKS